MIYAPLLTIHKAAHQLQVSTRTLRLLVETGALPCIRIGRLVRIAQTDLVVLNPYSSGVPARSELGKSSKSIPPTSRQNDEIQC